MDHGQIIGMKQAGLSNREFSRQTGKDRKTIPRVWGQYCALAAQLSESGADLKAIQAAMSEEPQSRRKKMQGS